MYFIIVDAHFGHSLRVIIIFMMVLLIFFFNNLN